MPRSLVLGNGTVLASFDECLQLRDLYFPHVGMEDHTTYGHVHRVGVFVEGKGFSWFSDGSWTIQPGYMRDTLVGQSTLRNENLGIEILLRDSVHPVRNVFLRNFTIRSLDGTAKDVRMFFHHNLYIGGDKQKDTAFYEPYTNSVIHYREDRYFLIGGSTTHPTNAMPPLKGRKYGSILKSMQQHQTCGLSSFTVGKADYRGLEGTWKDAEDGELTKNPIEQGSVDSTVAIHCRVEPTTETEVAQWICLGTNLDEVLSLQEMVLLETPAKVLRHAESYWRSWVNKTSWQFGSLTPAEIDLFKRSLLLIRTHVDHDGGILAAADNDIMAFNRDTYTYVWPRDGAFVSLALDAAGYVEVTRKFFRFCQKIRMPDGYLLHKYNPDGTLGSSWHPWYRSGEPQLPIQEDETALVIYALWHHFSRTNDFEFLQEMYEGFIKRAAEFLYDFREEHSGLPLPSYDPWEEHRGTFTYTTACTIAGLSAAAKICTILGHMQHAATYDQAATTMRQALLRELYDPELKRFLKKIKRQDDVTVERDATMDMSIAAIWMLEVLPPDDPHVISTMEQLRDNLWVKTPIGGLARYPGDRYHGCTEPSADIPGNPWIITTLWLAQWYIAKASTQADLQPAKDLLEWAQKRASSTGILPEQMHPLTGAPLSVAPLTWSHATYVETVIKYLRRERELLGGEMYRKISGN